MSSAKKESKPGCSISDIFTDEVKVESAKMLMETLRLREKLIDEIESE